MEYIKGRGLKAQKGWRVVGLARQNWNWTRILWICFARDKICLRIEIRLIVKGELELATLREGTISYEFSAAQQDHFSYSLRWWPIPISFA
jgi:hypothetical protein